MPYKTVFFQQAQLNSYYPGCNTASKYSSFINGESVFNYFTDGFLHQSLFLIGGVQHIANLSFLFSLVNIPDANSSDQFVICIQRDTPVGAIIVQITRNDFLNKGPGIINVFCNGCYQVFVNLRIRPEKKYFLFVLTF